MGIDISPTNLLHGSACNAANNLLLSQRENNQEREAHQNDVSENQMPIVEIQAGASHVIQIQRKEIHLARQDKQRIKHIIPDVQGYQNRRGSESRTEQRQNDGKKDSYRLSTIHTRRFLERHRNGTDETSDEENYVDM